LAVLWLGLSSRPRPCDMVSMVYLLTRGDLELRLSWKSELFWNYQSGYQQIWGNDQALVKVRGGNDRSRTPSAARLAPRFALLFERRISLQHSRKIVLN
jgi:hypothetical protein